MSIGAHVTEFAGRRVEPYVRAAGLRDPANVAYRIGLEYDAFHDGDTLVDALDALLAEPEAARLEAVVVGPWEFGSQDDSAAIVEALAAARDQLPSVRAIFLGDITYEESELSWIRHSDVSALLAAYPALEELRVRGSDGLALSHPDHAALRALTVESAGLSASVVRAIAVADYPSLERLELWLGTPGHGGDATVAELLPLLSGRRMPRLRHLAVRNAQIADEVARVLATSPLAPRLGTLDLSLGALGDDGAEALLAAASLAGLERLDLHHHYISAPMVRKLRARFGARLDASSAREEEAGAGDDASLRYCAVSE